MQIRLKYKEIETTYTEEKHKEIARTLTQEGYQAISLFRPEGDVSCLKYYDGFIQGLYLTFAENTVNMEKVPEYLPTLNALYLRDGRDNVNKKLSLDFLGQFNHLETVQVLNCRSDMTFLSQLKTVKNLQLSYLKHQQMDDILSLTQLELLKISNSTLYNVDFLQHLKKLKVLELECIRKLADLSPIKHLNALRNLHLDAMGGVVSLPDVSHNKQLEALILRNIHNLIDIDALTSDSLRHVFLAGSNKKLDFSPIKTYKTRLPNIKTFCFYQYSEKQTQEASSYIDEDILDNDVIPKYDPEWIWDFFYTDDLW